ncbi:MAG: S8 family serine peptidase [Bacteriovoracaceae bacterium]|nr:S8 family serine peptidase [Bacteriovoracaceae bacterium]
MEIKNNFLTLTAFIGLLFINACSNKSAPQKELSLISGDLFSDRPTNVTNTVVLIKLKGPSLIEGASKDEQGNLVITDELKAAVLNEQKETLEKARALSPDVKLLFSYKFTVNALALSVPSELYDQVGNLGTVAKVENETIFNRPENPLSKTELINRLVEKANEFKTTSVSHIGAVKAHEELGINGAGIKVGIIDTGVDFTHSMLGGPGDTQAYEQMNKEIATPLFPNQKVVGGYDFAGTDYSPGAVFTDWRTPRPDVNPMDEGGHGTHVAGTVAGIGDGVNTYNGVAPGADLYALKVFGNNGGTSDTVVIAAMEWSMDPNGDLDPSDRLDVLNLSLGGNFGKPFILYSLAIKNLAKAGVLTAISAGNSGPTPYIVGAPGTAEESVSVGASVDGMEKNWKFESVAFQTTKDSKLLAERVEANFTPRISDTPVEGKIVFVGDAASDFDEETKALLKGNIAFIDRGGVSFVEKVNRAEEAGAIGAVVANNQPGDAFIMGGEGKANIPAVMIPLDLGTSLKSALEAGDVRMNFASSEMIEKREIIDTLTSFSSQGPRSEDALLKPEIAAPGFQIISASMASGNQGVALNGTSMAAPHMAGVMALVKQKYPNFSSSEHKAVLMNTAKIMKSESGDRYSVTLQGAGLVDVYAALMAEAMVTPSSISLGEFQLEATKTLKKTILVKNTSDRDRTFTLNFLGEKNIQVEQQVFTVSAKSQQSVSFKIKLEANIESALEFHEGFILINEGPHKVASLPILGVSKRLTRIEAQELNVFSSHSEDSFDALTELKLTNDSKNAGVTEIFNLLGEDDRKPSAGADSLILSRSCDLQAAGYRMVESEGKMVMQVGIKLFSAVSNWQACELSILIDQNGDKLPEQEIGGLPHNYLSGLSDIVPAGFYSVLLDFPKAVELRQAHEQSAMANNGNAEGELTYVPALLDVLSMQTYANSHLAIMEIDPSKLALTKEGRINMKITVFSEGGVEYEDGLQQEWFTVSPLEEEQAYRKIPASIKVPAMAKDTVELTKGYGKESLMIVSPFNYQVGNTRTSTGRGLSILKPQF